MHGVNVVGGELSFSPECVLEGTVLSWGVKGARKHIRETFSRKIALKINKIPVIVPTSREEVYERAYALIREIGRGVGEELRRMGYPPDERTTLSAALLRGFLTASFDRKDRRDDYVGAARLFYDCGDLIAHTMISVFPEKDGEPEPDADEPFVAFWRGVADVMGGEWAQNRSDKDDNNY